MQNKLKFVDSLQIMTLTSSWTHIKADLRITVHRMVRHENNLFIPLTSFDCQSFSYVLMKHSTFLTHTPKTETNNGVKVPYPKFIYVYYDFVSFPVHDS